MIIRCFCTADSRGSTVGAKFQDETYGRYFRVHNPCFKDGKSQSFRCTVCGQTKTATGDVVKDKK